MSVLDAFIDEEDATPELKIGTRVFVLDCDGETALGYGTYMGLVPATDFIAAQDDGEDLEPDDPELSDEEEDLAEVMALLAQENATVEKIVLESGEIVYGFQCFWREVPGENTRLN